LLQLVREFLEREFRNCEHRDFFAFDTTAQVFVIGSERNLRYTLVIPKETFEDPDSPVSSMCTSLRRSRLRAVSGSP